jgi:hypothetical protein
MNFLRGYPAILVAAINLLFFPIAVFEFAIGSIARIRASLRVNLKTVLFWIWLLSFILLWNIFDYFRYREFRSKLAMYYILAGIVIMVLMALRKLFVSTDILSEIKALLSEANIKKEWLIPGVCFGMLCLLASLVVSYFPLSGFTFHPPPGMTFLYAHPQVARQIDARAAQVHGARQRDTLLFLKALGLHMKGDLDAAEAIYRQLPKRPWVLNNQAAILFQRGRRQDALKAWQDLARRNFFSARANLEQAPRAGGAASDAS